jgi:formate hydrogenlyase subunit 4
MDLGSPVKESAFFLSVLAALSIAVGLVESSMARLRLLRVPRLLMAACVLAVFAVALQW